MTLINIHQIATILENDRGLFEKIKQFSEELGNSGVRFDQSKNLFKMGPLTPYEFLCNELQYWQSRLGFGATLDKVIKILEKIECKLAADLLCENYKQKRKVNACDFNPKNKEDHIKGQQIEVPITHRLIIPPVAHFTGRDEELQKLKSYFQNSPKDERAILLCGCPGIGKTELCRNFIHLITTSCDMNNTGFIYLYGETTQDLKDSISELARALGYSKSMNNLEGFRYNESSVLLHKYERLVLIIDHSHNGKSPQCTTNDESDETITQYIQKIVRNEKIFGIVLSSDSNICTGEVISINLDIFSQCQAKTMIKNSLDVLNSVHCWTDSDSDELGKLMLYFPLALQYASAYINQQIKRSEQYVFSNYVEEFKETELKIYNQPLKVLDFNTTTSIACDITMSEIDDSALDIWTILAHLEPDRVELKFLEDICKQDNDDIQDFTKGLHQLANYSLAKQVDTIICIHQLAQNIMIDTIPNPNEYSKSLFDCVLLTTNRFGKGGPLWSEKCHLKRVGCRAYPNCEIKMNYFHEALLFLTKNERITCAVKYVKRHCENIQFNSDLDVVENTELLEKLFLWSILNNNDYSSVTNQIIVRGAYSSLDLSFVNSKSLEAGLSIAQKYFVENRAIIFAVKNKLAKRLCYDKETDKALTLCEDIISCQLSLEQKRIFSETLLSIVNRMGECKYKNISTVNLQKLFELSARLDNVDSAKLLNIISKHANAFHKRKSYRKSLDLYEKIHTHFEMKNNAKMANAYRFKVLQQQIQLVDYNKISKDEILRQFSDADYENFSLIGLQRILPPYERILGSNHSFTCRIKIAIAKAFQFSNKNKSRCIELCEEVLISSFTLHNEDVFNMLCEVKNIKDDDNEQRKLLQKTLADRRLKIKSETSTLQIAVARVIQKFSEYPLAPCESFRGLICSAARKLKWDDSSIVNRNYCLKLLQQIIDETATHILKKLVRGPGDKFKDHFRFFTPSCDPKAMELSS